MADFHQIVMPTIMQLVDEDEKGLLAPAMKPESAPTGIAFVRF
jgi:hypothetical protein